MTITDLINLCGINVIPGTRTRMLVVCSCDIQSFPHLNAFEPDNPTAGITLNGNIVLKPGKNWASISIIADSGQIKHELVGTRGSKNYVNSYDFKILKTIIADAWFQQNGNNCIVALVRQKDGTYRVFGTLEMPAWIETATGDSGNTLDTEVAWTAQIKDNIGKVCPIYTGTVYAGDIDDFDNNDFDPQDFG